MVVGGGAGANAWEAGVNGLEPGSEFRVSLGIMLGIMSITGIIGVAMILKKLDQIIDMLSGKDKQPK